jgi:O-6-methylguanine DNA methyltransferase
LTSTWQILIGNVAVVMLVLVGWGQARTRMHGLSRAVRRALFGVTMGELCDHTVVEYLEGKHPGLVVPLDLQGTHFQVRVWQALRRIPVGEVRTYAEIAAMIESPRSTRAVARACAGNKAAVAVPCHRVIRADGSLGGYRWGEDRKRKLLEHERELARKPAEAGAASNRRRAATPDDIEPGENG